MPTNPDLAALSAAAEHDQIAAMNFRLVLAYEFRRGNLVQIDREEWKRKISGALIGFHPLPPGKTIMDAADAALAAILGVSDERL